MAVEVMDLPQYKKPTREEVIRRLEQADAEALKEIMVEAFGTFPGFTKKEGSD